MNRFLIKSFLYAGLVCALGCQQGNTFNERFTDTSSLTSQRDTLPYYLYKPSSFVREKKYPLIVFLHGYGQDVFTSASPGLRNLVSESVQNRYPSYVLAPQCPKGQKWVDTDWRLKAHRISPKPTIWLEKATSLIYEIIQSYSIDTQRVYLTGLSMGGFGTWDLAMRQPNLFAALVPVCGGGDSIEVGRIAHIPTWVFHGTQDDVISVERSRSMVRSLRRQGAKVLYTEFPTMKHNSWDSAYSSPNLYAWLFSQSK